jgi:ribonuclease E
MLINATQDEELRVAIVDGQKLYDLDIEAESSEQKKSNIYQGVITRVEPSLDAVFVDFGADRHGFLPLKDISHQWFRAQPESGSRINIREVLKEGQVIIVQVDKDERGTKGAALTTFISLAGRFLVLMPNNPRGGGVSRRIAGEEREEVRNALRKLELDENQSCIIRTAGIGRSQEELDWDLKYLSGIWEAILNTPKKDTPFLIYRESSPVVRALRDHFNQDVGEITIDDKEAYDEAHKFMSHTMPHNLNKLKQYEGDVPLFTRFQIESQIESAFAHTVQLPSGGSLVIDLTEALVSIDINSARATKGHDIESTALSTNLEAAEEVARQCRIRDLGGLLVIDFIDMGPNKNQRDVENRLRDSVKTDRARVQIGRISRFGLMEMSRQRLRRSLGESAHQVCPRCNGSGTIRGVESLALSILRLVGEEARKERAAKVIAELPIDVATFLLNEKREWIQSIEQASKVQLVLIANPALETPNYTIRRVRDDQTLLAENSGASYSLTTTTGDLLEDAVKLTSKRTIETAAVSAVTPDTPAPEPIKKAEPKAVKSTGGIFGFFKRLFTGSEEEEKKTQDQSRQRNRNRNSSGRNDRSNNQQNRNRNSRRGKSASSGNRGKDNQNRSRGSSSDNNSNRKKPASQQSGEQQKEANENSENSKDENQSQNPSRRRRRRRRPPQNQDGSGQNEKAENSQSGQDNAANKPATESTHKVDNSAARQPEAQSAISGEVRPTAAAETQKAQPTSTGTEATKSKPADQGNRATPAKPPTNTDGNKAPPADNNKSSNSNERLLPWESPKANNDSGKTYKVWSSDSDEKT